MIARRVTLAVLPALFAGLGHAWLGHAWAQDPGRVYRLGVLATSAGSLDGIRRYTLPELARLGFVDGRNLAIEERNAGGDASQLRPLARELAARQVDVVIAVSNIAIRAARDEIARAPIVMAFAGDDPVEAGFAESLARPGGRITGVAMRGVEGDAKRLELIRDAMPAARRIGYLLSEASETDRDARMRRTAEALGIELVIARVRGMAEYPAAIAALTAGGAQAVAIGTNPVFSRDAAALSAMMTAAGLATICEWREMARDGCMMAYGPNSRELRRRTAHYVARVLRGQPPGEIPIEEPNVFELAVNLRVAQQLGIALPRAVLARAEDLVE